MASGRSELAAPASGPPEAGALTPNEQRALAELLWLASGAKSHAEIAAKLGCSRQRVSQIEKRGFAKLRKLMRPRTEYPD